MIFSYDKFNRMERPILYLANPYKTYIGTIHNTELKMDLCFNSMSELTFKTYKYVNGEEMPNYDDIEVLKLIESQYIAWFQITECVEYGEGKTKYKEVTARTLENELCKKMLNSFGSMGVSTDSQGGLDRYCLYNILDTDHSILHIVMEKAPLWTVGHIDPEITTEYRSFNEDSIDAYTFLTDNVARAFECVFVFDTFNRTINAYKLENIGKETSVFLSHRNVIEHAQIEESADDIYTVMTVCGGDYDGNPLQITDVNPTGTSYICNFNYYYPWFSDELKVKITEFNKACDDRKGGYTTALSVLKELMLELEDINNRVPETPHSTNWSEYGVIELQSEFNYYNQKMSVYLDGQNESKRMEYYNILYGTNGIQNTLSQRKSEYAVKETEIAHQKNVIDNFVLNMEDFLGNKLYKELSSYFYYTDFVDDTFVATRAMDDSEILEMKLALFEEAERKLSEVSHPSYTMTIDSENFFALPKYREYAEQLYLGCMVSVEFEEDKIITPRLLKISIDWEDLNNFTLTFSSKTSLDDGIIQMEEIYGLASSTANSQILSGIGWDAAKNNITPVSDFMNNAFNAAKNGLFSGKNQEVITDGSGTRYRKWLDELNDYSPKQMWHTNNGIYLTNSAWETVDTAIGELNLGTDANGNNIILYGIAAPLLLGKMTISEYLYIYNNSGSYTITDDGLVATNGINTLKITPNDNEIFSILKGSEKRVWFDANGNAWFKGNITASEITSSKYTCTNGINTILIDPNNSRLFQILNGSNPVLYFAENGDAWFKGNITASKITSSKFTCSNGINTVLIDPDSPKLFQIFKGNTPVLYFTENGDAVFEGKMTVGTIFSKNWLTSGGDENGTKQGTEGTFINLVDGTFHFGGEHLELTEEFLKCNGESNFNWMGVEYPTVKRFVKISESYIQTQYDDGTINLFITPRGIATGKSAICDPDASGVSYGIIDFYSKFLGDNLNGITIRTHDSPVCLSSAKGTVVLNPNDYISNDLMFAFNVSTDNQSGLLRYGYFKSKNYGVGIAFNHNENKIKITNGSTGLGTLHCGEITCTVDGKDLKKYLETLKQDWQTDLDNWAAKYNSLNATYLSYKASHPYSSCSSCCS